MKPVGKPDAGNPHVRFDERGGETERIDVIEADTAPFLDSTEAVGTERVQRPLISCVALKVSRQPNFIAALFKGGNTALESLEFANIG